MSSCTVKMPLNPCPCLSLERATKVVALIDAVLTVVIACHYLNYGIVISNRTTQNEEAIQISEGKNLDNKDKTTTGIPVKYGSDWRIVTAAIIFAVIITICQFLLDLTLYYGANAKNRNICWAWLGVTTFTVTFDSLLHILGVTEIFDGSALPEMKVFLGTVVFRTYAALVVLAFILMLRKRRQHSIFSEALPVETETQQNLKTLGEHDDVTGQPHNLQDTQPSSSSSSSAVVSTA